MIPPESLSHNNLPNPEIERKTIMANRLSIQRTSKTSPISISTILNPEVPPQEPPKATAFLSPVYEADQRRFCPDKSTIAVSPVFHQSSSHRIRYSAPASNRFIPTNQSSIYYLLPSGVTQSAPYTPVSSYTTPPHPQNQSGQGLIPTLIDYSGSREKAVKRRKNAQASQRFRRRKKQTEAELLQKIKILTKERDYYKSLYQQSVEGSHIYERGYE